MNITTFLNTVGYFLSKYYPEELDPSLKPRDSSGCKSCRNIVFDFIIVGAGTAGKNSDIIINLTTFLNTVGYFLSKYYPEELDPSLKPRDSSGFKSCRNIMFDFIIVGAGTAGCVLANRLSENPDWKVLLIEAGDNEDYITDIPLMSGLFAQTKYDWNYTTIRQKNACYSMNREGYCEYQRGHVMGGSSSTNILVHVRGNKHDYDLWEEMGNPGWNYESLLHYFLKSENMTIPELSRSPYHSTDGPLTVSYSRYNTTILQDILDASRDLGLPVVDYNGATQYGVGYAQLTMRESTRCSSSKAYLDPIRNRPNLYIFMNTLVTKVLFSKGALRRAVGVSCITAGERYNVYARKEVILSAGFINTPKLLMLSGVGHRDHLEELNITVYADLPSVGLNLVDHPSLTLLFSINSSEFIYTDTVKAINAIEEYAKFRRGVLTISTGSITLFCNSTNSSIIDTQIIIGFSEQGLARNMSGISLYLGNMRPKSLGSVRLQSANFADPPLLDPNYFDHISDTRPIKYAFRQALKILSSLKKYSPEPTFLLTSYCNITEPLTEGSLDCLIKYFSFGGLHGTGTARMGQPSDNNTVVDPSLKVHTIDNLRVVDASVMPTIPTGNINAVIYAVAEKASDIIKISNGYVN